MCAYPFNSLIAASNLISSFCTSPSLFVLCPHGRELKGQVLHIVKRLCYLLSDMGGPLPPAMGGPLPTHFSPFCNPVNKSQRQGSFLPSPIRDSPFAVSNTLPKAYGPPLMGGPFCPTVGGPLPPPVNKSQRQGSFLPSPIRDSPVAGSNTLPKAGGPLLLPVGGPLLPPVGGPLLPPVGGPLLPPVGGPLPPLEHACSWIDMAVPLTSDIHCRFNQTYPVLAPHLLTQDGSVIIWMGGPFPPPMGGPLPLPMPPTNSHYQLMIPPGFKCSSECIQTSSANAASDLPLPTHDSSLVRLLFRRHMDFGQWADHFLRQWADHFFCRWPDHFLRRNMPAPG
ncbi:proline-rich protein HaeIII subfamily 1-like isoform X2 [Silurus meridionalis]|uniref:proline-rich protein HaeIII subfamily 1-like isoform X2 n=1 Tax=Silurus meridionalis TaxID=175797 RepID=UPI001EEC7EA8|nr:proline-rich protein HaeIII subfamily 1-like isoform X2 [Silurus meridionalis]